MANNIGNISLDDIMAAASAGLTEAAPKEKPETDEHTKHTGM